jgi:hypothetical protein
MLRCWEEVQQASTAQLADCSFWWIELTSFTTFACNDDLRVAWVGGRCIHFITLYVTWT